MKHVRSKKLSKTDYSDLQEYERLFLAGYVQECDELLSELSHHENPDDCPVDLDTNDWNEFQAEAKSCIEQMRGDLASLYFQFLEVPKLKLPSPIEIEDEESLETSLCKLKTWCHQAHYALAAAETPILSDRALEVAKLICAEPGLSGAEIDKKLGLDSNTTAKMFSRYLKYFRFVNEGRGYFPPGYSDTSVSWSKHD